MNLQEKVMTAASEMMRGCPLKDFLTDEEIEAAIRMLADVLITTRVNLDF